MIRIKTIHIEEFRGIRNLTLNLDGESFGIYGPNGAGKSGVVDAIEFCITGNITRLSGPGQGVVKVKSHAPHVDQSNKQDKAKVTITAAIPSLGEDVTIARSVKTPQNLPLHPKIPKSKKLLKNCNYIQSSRFPNAKSSNTL